MNTRIISIGLKELSIFGKNTNPFLSRIHGDSGILFTATYNLIEMFLQRNSTERLRRVTVKQMMNAIMRDGSLLTIVHIKNSVYNLQ